MIVLYVGPIFGLAMVAGALYACFSIYGFYYKTWRGGKRLKSCPQWEPLQQLMPPASSVRIGPVVRKPVSGWVMVALGGLLFLWELVLMGKGIQRGSNALISTSLLPLPVVSVFLAYGVQRLIGTHTVTCPHCRKSVKRSATVPYYICPYCKKTSIRQGDAYTSETYLRNLLQFQDLPKL